MLNHKGLQTFRNPQAWAQQEHHSIRPSGFLIFVDPFGLKFSYVLYILTVGINSVISKINSKPLKGTTLIATECMVKTTDSVASNSAVLTNDILIDNLPDEKCSTSKLSKHFCSKKKSGISFCKGIKIVKRNMAVIQLEDENGIELLCMFLLF